MPTLEHEVTIASTPSSVFQALTTQEGCAHGTPQRFRATVHSVVSGTWGSQARMPSSGR